MNYIQSNQERPHKKRLIYSFNHQGAFYSCLEETTETRKVTGTNKRSIFDYLTKGGKWWFFLSDKQGIKPMNSGCSLDLLFSPHSSKGE